ncbi:MAG: hypothetical protein PHP53_24330 [Prolixibacteraceae bacterium]|nr:hypothetical protein [Prolixibacteraceae bacterium]
MKSYRKSRKYQQLLVRAADMNDVLFPHEAMEWIESAFGQIIENISHSTIHMMVFDLCLRNGYVADIVEVDEAIFDSINA